MRGFSRCIARCVHSTSTRRSNVPAAASAVVPLTRDTYQLQRGNFAHLQHVHIQQFENILDSERVLSDPSEIEGFNIDWFKSFRGSGKVVLKPRTTEEVSRILRFCNQEKLAVVIQGGNTGVLGGSVPVFDEVILSTSLMNKIIQINDIPGSVVCQAGCVLESLDTALADYGLMMPHDLGAKGSCHIGGNVATNAGGLRFLRYGSLQANVLGLQVVLANGEILDCMNTLKKDNTGYHLKHLFVGSEGTLGVVTEVAIQCPPKPQSKTMAFLGLSDFTQVLNTFRLARTMLSEILSSCEVIDCESLQLLDSLGLRSPLNTFPFYLLVEAAGSHSAHDEEKLNSFLEKVMADGVVLDGLVTAEPSKINALWELRERLPEALFKDKYAFMYDVSLPLEHYYELVVEMRNHLKDTEVLSVTGFGHLGDGNLHLNICCKKFSPEVLAQIEPFIFQWIHHHEGSISAEHGIGVAKPKYLKYSKSRAAIQTMIQIKQLMDPNGILNPYKVLPQI